MQSSLAAVLSLTSGFSPCPCVSIFGTGPCGVLAAAFRMPRALGDPGAHFTSPRLPRLPRVFRHPVQPHVSVTPSHRMGYWNLRQSSIGYASRPRLRSRLSQGGRAFPWRPWAIGVQDSHLHLATHAGILSSIRSTCPSGHASSFGVMLSPGKLSARSHSTSELLRTLQRMAASEPTS